MGLGVWGLEFRVYGVRFRAYGLGVWGLRFRMLWIFQLWSKDGQPQGFRV